MVSHNALLFSGRGRRGGGCTPWRSLGRVVLTRAEPLAVARQLETPEDQGVDGIAEQDLGEGILAVAGGEQFPYRLLRELDEFIAVEPGLVLLDLVFDPGEVELARRGAGFGHADIEYVGPGG